MSNSDRWSGYGYVFFGVSFAVGFLALVDWAAEGNILEYALGIWNSWPELMRLVVLCLVIGVAAVLGMWMYLVRSAVLVDENECPIQVKGKK